MSYADENGYSPAVLKKLVEEKEKEWRGLAEMRAEKAEAAAEKLQSELRLDKEKIEKIKNDFSYNLELLAARDKELDTADKTVEDLRQSLFAKERECSDLYARVDCLKVELENSKKSSAEQVERLRIDCDKKLNKQHADFSAQQVSMKTAKHQLETRLAEVEANFHVTRRQLEDGFQEELNRTRKNHDTHMDEARGQLAAAETEARLLARELELVRESERSKRSELGTALDAVETMTHQMRKLEWDLADQSSTLQSDVKELQIKLGTMQEEREAERSHYEQKLAQTNKDLAEKVMMLERLQRCRFEDAGEAGKRIGEMQGELSRLRASSEKFDSLEDELRLEKETAQTYRIQLHQCESQVMSLTEANVKLEAEVSQLRQNAGGLNLSNELQNLTMKYSQVEEHNKKLLQQNEVLKEAVRQMKDEVEVILQASKPGTSKETSKDVVMSSHETQTDFISSIFYDDSYLPEAEKEVPLPGDPRIRAYVDSLVRRTSNLQHRCSELLAEGRRQQIKAESAVGQLESLESNSQRLRASLEHARYELSAERSRYEADRIAAKKQIADLEERLAEARVIADEFHAEANNANTELSELRRRLASHELTQKSATSGVGFGGQELYIQQLEDQIKDLAIRGKPQDSSEANSRLKRAIGIIVQLQKDRMRLLDLAARLRATAEDYRVQLEESSQAVSKTSRPNEAPRGPPLSTRSNLRPQSNMEKLETIAYERMREKLANQMSHRSREPSEEEFANIDQDLAELSTSFPNSEAIQNLLEQIDSTSHLPPSEAPLSSRSRAQLSPGRPVGQAKTRTTLGSSKSPAQPVKGRGKPVSRVWVSESSPPPLRGTGIGGFKGQSYRK